MPWGKVPAFLKSHQWCQKTENNSFRVATTLQLTALPLQSLRLCLHCYTLRTGRGKAGSKCQHRHAKNEFCHAWNEAHRQGKRVYRVNIDFRNVFNAITVFGYPQILCTLLYWPWRCPKKRKPRCTRFFDAVPLSLILSFFCSRCIIS